MATYYGIVNDLGPFEPGNVRLLDNRALAEQYAALIPNAKVVTLSDTQIPNLAQLPIYADNAAAVAAGLVTGDLYHTGVAPDAVLVVTGGL